MPSASGNGRRPGVNARNSIRVGQYFAVFFLLMGRTSTSGGLCPSRVHSTRQRDSCGRNDLTPFDQCGHSEAQNPTLRTHSLFVTASITTLQPADEPDKNDPTARHLEHTPLMRRQADTHKNTAYSAALRRIRPSSGHWAIPEQHPSGLRSRRPSESQLE